MKTISDNSSFVPSQKMAYRTIGGRAVLVNTLENRIVILNETGTFIWNKLDTYTVREIARELADYFEVDEQQAFSDTINFILDMKRRGFVDEF